MAGKSYADAWKEASEQTGLDQVSPEMGPAIGITLFILELGFWIVSGWMARKGIRLFRRNRGRSGPQEDDGRGNRSWPPQVR